MSEVINQVECPVPADMIVMPFDQKVEYFVSNVFGGLHRVRRLKQVQMHYEVFPIPTSLATWDDCTLTKIVLWSCKLGLRAEIEPNGLHGLRILLHNRICRVGRLYDRHPDIQEAISILTPKS